MDTLLFCEKNYKKIIETAVNVSIIGVLILCQALLPIKAERIAQVTAPDFDTGQLKERLLNEISLENRARNFDIMIRQKYPKAAIYDVTQGVKHIKLTKYYNNRPVKINVVEVDMKLAKGFELTPALSSGDTLNSRKTITSIAKSKNAIVAYMSNY